MSTQRLLRLPQVMEAVNLSRSEIYRLISLKRFPSQVPLGDFAVAWVEREVQDFILSRIERRDAQSKSARPAA